jgi:orotate phosphoribosyltransferase/predicted phosphodiesterase
MNILHVTDFHIDTPTGDTENLRDGFYQEFIDNLFTLIGEKGLGKIDMVIHTGDFINVGKTENYSHAKKVLNYILQKAGLTNNAIAVCVGNHDFKMKEPGTWDEKKTPFYEFSKDFIPGELIEITNRAQLFNNKVNDIQVLVIDNASRADDVNEPVPLTVTEQDEIIGLARSHINTKDLIVVSHYPMITFPMAKYAAENQEWVKSHVWNVGHNIQHRLSQLRPQGRTFYLCGDGHIPDAFQSGNRTFVMTGLFGGNYTKRDFKGKPFFMQTQARIIAFEGSATSLSTFNYKPLGFDYDVTNGEWDHEISNIREVIDKNKSTAIKSESRTLILSDPLEKEIINRIKKERLYKLGRFVTSAEFHSMSWISINRLFEEQQIFVSLIDKGLEWLKQIIKEDSKALIIGVDFYGAMIGTHLAIRGGFRNECFTSRYLETDDREPIVNLVTIISNMTDIKDIIFVTDVVSSGHSVLKMISHIETEFEKLKGIKLDAKYHSISVISDTNIVRDDFDTKINTIKTACGSLRMPIIRSTELPDTEILSSRIDFTN